MWPPVRRASNVFRSTAVSSGGSRPSAAASASIGGTAYGALVILVLSLAFLKNQLHARRCRVPAGLGLTCTDKFGLVRTTD